ncbi:MAG: cytochrome C oxidase subunit IV family protein [Leptospiraceae bacterium]|nr:cytochrome C oxidase subunit IV family protein [Leptospiraceae bacterium]
MDLFYRQNPIEKDYHGHPNYFMVYVWLLVFFVVSLLSDFFENHTLAVFLIFSTAFVKMLLVVANFMHLKYEPKAFWVIPIFGAICIVSFLLLVYPDITMVKRIITIY